MSVYAEHCTKIYCLIIIFTLFFFFSQIDSSKLIGCRELVARCLSTHTASLPPNTVYVCHPLQTPYDPSVTFHPVLPPLPLRRKPSAKRKVEQMDVDEYFDGIKRLYNEEELGGGGGVTSGYQSIEGESTPCPALQPVAVSEQCAWR